jgi:hypothetical protein
MPNDRRRMPSPFLGAAFTGRAPRISRDCAAARPQPRPCFRGSRRATAAAIVLPLVVLALLSLASCGSSGAPALGTPSTIQVVLTQEPPSPLQVAAVSPVIATVLNDTQNMGVDWQVSCTVVKCGTFSPAHTASGAATTYTAPASVPTQLSAASATVNLTAVSTADPTKSITVTLSITGPPISIAFSAPAPPTTLQTNSGVTLNATLTNDVSTAGADWALSCAGKGSACGTLTSSHTSDTGGSVVSNVYVAPAAVPGGGGYVTITVTATADKTKSASATIQIVTPPVTVTFSQIPSTVPAGSTASMTATVTNDPTNKGVTWSVSCSSSSCGSFNPTATASGAATIYTAPATAPTGGTVTIKAISVANSASSVSSVVSITSPQAVSISYTTSPPESLQTGAQASIIATVTNDSSNAGVDWSVTCGTGNSSCGSFSLAHTVSGGATTFTAPLTAPSTSSVTITATATATEKASTPATAVATVTISSAGRSGLLLGQYAFSVSGTDAKGFYAAVGSVILDGNGNVKSGEEDFADTAGVHPTASLTGTYVVGNDGRGSMSLLSSDTTVGVNGVETLDLVVVGSQQAFVIEFDSSATSHGSLDLQTPSSFSQAAITSSYSFTLSGVDLTNSAAIMDLGGVLTADGKGNFTTVTEDVSDGGTVTSSTPTGTYATEDSFGRGTATIGSTATYAYYVVNPGAMIFIETDTSGLTAGSAFTQGAAPAFSAASLSGSYAFTAQGRSSSGALAVGGLLAFDGKGNITSTTTLDVNNGGTVSSGSPTGTYTVASNGRGTATLGTATGGVALFDLYLTASQGVLLLETDSGLTSAGAGLLQASGITAATFSGSYAGILDLAAKTGEEDADAEVTSDGVSTLTGGTMDLNSFGAPTPLAPSTALTGSFTANSNGRFPGSFSLSTTPATTLSEIFYVVNSTTVLFTDVDAANPGSGQLQLQQFPSGPAVTIAFTQSEAPPPTLQEGATATMAATVTNDLLNQGVNWTVSCLASDCGSFNPTHTTSGVTTTYTAPNANITVTITATAVADQTQHVQASVIVGTGSIAISIAFTAPPPSDLQVATSASITATVSNDSSNAGVNWSVTCGGTDCGSFTPSAPAHTASGSPITYTAPGTVPSGNTVTITASAAASPSTTAVGTTTISTTPPPQPQTPVISPGPSNGQLQASAQWTYFATVTNDTGGVTWSVSCSNGSDGCGSFSPSQTACGPAAQGVCTTASTVYTAPTKIASGSLLSVTLTATLTDDASVAPGQAPLAIISAGSPGLLGTGWFTFYLTGNDSSNNNSSYGVVGSVYLNGTGGITPPSGTGNAGEEDFEDASNMSSQAAIGITGGSYSIGPDGRGLMTLNTTDTDIGVLGVQTLSFAVTSTAHALITEFDGFAGAAGSLDQQGASLSQASVTGAYAFLFSGVDVSAGSNSGAPLGLGGVVTADGKGDFSGVTEDLNDGGTVSSFVSSGTTKDTFSAFDSYGRGTATLGSDPADCTTAPPAATYVFYVVDGTTLRFLQNDTCGVTAGSMLTQGTSLATGPYAFTVSGAAAAAPLTSLAAGGVFTLSGNAISGENIDVNNVGTVTQSLTPSGTYTNPSSGRFTLSFGTLTAGIDKFDGYLTASAGVLLLEADGTSQPVTTGTAFAQASGVNAIAAGDYATDFYGVANTGSKFPEMALGQVYSNGTSLLAGAADVNQLGQPGSPFTNSPLSGSFTNCAGGRCTGSLSTTPTGSISENFYVVNNSAALFMETDANGEVTGLLQGQQGFQIPPEVVITNPPAPSVQLSMQTTTTAFVTNDQTNSGVNWTLTCSPAGTACGSITANTASGAPATYTAPATLPGTSTYLLVTMTAASANNPKSTSSVQVVVYSTTAGEIAVISTWPGNPPPGSSAMPLETGSFGLVSAVVINDPSKTPTVNWSLSCGGTDCGSIPENTSSGATSFYTAPSTVPAPINVVDGIGQGTVTITAAPADVSGGCAATPDPCTSETTTITGGVGTITATWSLAPPATIFTDTAAVIQATVSGANDSNPLVTYSCSWTATGSCGTFTAPGGTAMQTLTVSDAVQVTYSAPATAGTVTLTATSGDDPAVSVTASVMVQSPGLVALLKGQYALSFSGTQQANVVNGNLNGTGQSGFYAVVGSVNLNGLGGVESGEEDYYVAGLPLDVSGETNAQVLSTGSSYAINPDGTGTLTLNTSSILCLGIPQLDGDCVQTLQFVVVDSSRALVIQYDGSATSDGSLDLQSGLTSSGFPLSSITGPYAFTLFGVDNSISDSLASFGLGGVLTANPTGFSWTGVGDSNDDGFSVETDQSLSGGYNDTSTEAQPGHCGSGGSGDTDPCGRSSATITLAGTTYNLVYYVVNQNYIKILDIDDSGLPAVLGVGAMYSAANPAQLGTGNYVFTLEGGEYVFAQTSPPPVAAGGVFSSPGGSSGDLTGVTLDVNDNGKVVTGCVPTGTNTFSINANGRGTLTFGTNACAGSDTFSNFAIYPTSATGPLNGGVLMLQIDTNSKDKFTITSGTAYPQAASPAFSGTYGASFDSIVTEPSDSNDASEQDMVGQITVSSSSICSGGTSCGTSTGMYINQANVFEAFGPYSATPLSGSFVNGSNGRYVETITLTVGTTPYTLNEIFYAGVNGNNTVLSLETDPFGTGSQSFEGPGVGLLQIQNLTLPGLPLPQGRRAQNPILPLARRPEPSPAKPENPRGPRLP